MNTEFLVGCNDSTEPTLFDSTYTCQHLSSLVLRPGVTRIVAIMSPLLLGISYPATSPGIRAPKQLAGASIISRTWTWVEPKFCFLCGSRELELVCDRCSSRLIPKLFFQIVLLLRDMMLVPYYCSNVIFHG